MNESLALDELVLDYVEYCADRIGLFPPGAGLTFTQWCSNPQLCDQELLAQTMMVEGPATIRDLRTQLTATLTALLQISRDTRERLVPAEGPFPQPEPRHE